MEKAALGLVRRFPVVSGHWAISLRYERLTHTQVWKIKHFSDFLLCIRRTCTKTNRSVFLLLCIFSTRHLDIHAIFKIDWYRGSNYMITYFRKKIQIKILGKKITVVKNALLWYNSIKIHGEDSKHSFKRQFLIIISFVKQKTNNSLKQSIIFWLSLILNYISVDFSKIRKKSHIRIFSFKNRLHVLLVQPVRLLMTNSTDKITALQFFLHCSLLLLSIEWNTHVKQGQIIAFVLLKAKLWVAICIMVLLHANPTEIMRRNIFHSHFFQLPWS